MGTTGDRRLPPPTVGSRTAWSEEEELRLLEAVLEIAEESPEVYNPSVSLFLRIGRRLEGTFENEEVLRKVKEVRRSYESGDLDASASANPSRLRLCELCAKVWGDRVIEIPPSSPPPS